MCPRRHHSQSTSRNQPSNRESILVKVTFSMILSSIPKSSITVNMNFRKDHTHAGVYYFNHQYCLAPCLAISPLPGRMVERAQLQPLLCMSLTRGSSVCGISSRPRQIQIHRHILHTPSSFIFFHLSHRHPQANGKFKLEDPWRHPHKLVSR